MEFSVEKPLISDIKSIHGLLMGGAEQGLLLPRPLSDLYNHVREFFVLRDPSGAILACSALSVVWEDIAEVRSLFVTVPLRGKGAGRALVEACLDDAQRMGLNRVFTLTYETAFFNKMGFSEVGKDKLPQKIWADCIHCPKFPDCDEVAMLRSL